MDPTLLEMIIAAGVIVLGNGGIVHMSVKRNINGLHEEMHEMKVDVKEIRQDVGGLKERVTRNEAVLAVRGDGRVE